MPPVQTTPNTYDPKDIRNRSIEGLMEGETKLCEIHKHPFGIISLYIASIVGIIAAFVLVFFLFNELVSADQRGNISAALSVAVIIGVAFLGVGLLIATYVYFQSRLIITNKNVTQILQLSLFNRQISELSMASVEDVTAQQRGILATMFNYGELRIETAGEQNNFHFSYCPRPNYYGKIILDARQHYADSLQENPLERH